MAEVDIAAMLQMMGAIATDLRDMRRENKAEHEEINRQIASLRHTVTQYHSSVIGHGIMISELEDRVRRVETHLNLPPYAAE